MNNSPRSLLINDNSHDALIDNTASSSTYNDHESGIGHDFGVTRLYFQLSARNWRISRSGPSTHVLSILFYAVEARIIHASYSPPNKSVTGAVTRRFWIILSFVGLTSCACDCPVPVLDEKPIWTLTLRGKVEICVERKGSGCVLKSPSALVTSVREAVVYKWQLWFD